MEQTRIIFLMGESGVGKDTIGQVFCDKHGYTRVSFADAMKYKYAEDNNLPDSSVLFVQGPEKEKHRPGLIHFAETEKLKDPLVWLNKAFSPYVENGSFKEGLKLIVTDFRRECEVDWLYDLKATIFNYNNNAIEESVTRNKNLENKNYPTVYHYVTPFLFSVERLTNDSDILTHKAIGYAKGINKVSTIPFIDCIVDNNIPVEQVENKVTRLVQEFQL